MSTTTTELTQEEKRIKIAEACGWRWVPHPITGIGGYWEHGQPGIEGYARGDWGSRELGNDLPDYFGSLDAMHEAEKVLTDPHTPALYHHFLMEICSPDADRLAKDWTHEQYGAAMQASATQRANAFGKALNLWP